jgi:four helix bundle protein
VCRTSDLNERMSRFAVRLVCFCRTLPHTRESDVIGRQLLRAGTGMPANYRAAGRARSYADFISKMGIAAEEGDETVYWLRIVIEAELGLRQEAQDLRTEAHELMAICAASHKTAKSRQAGRKRETP